MADQPQTATATSLMGLFAPPSPTEGPISPSQLKPSPGSITRCTPARLVDENDQVQQFSSQRNKIREPNVTRVAPSEYGTRWGVAATLFDRPWSKLSGGESQRIVLAIALSLQPDVLLMDESTSALDERTEMLVETTIKNLQVPVILVSHSRSQIDRFCNERLSLERTVKTSVQVKVPAPIL